MSKNLSVDTAEKLVEFAFKNNAIVEQKKFKDFDRCVILTVRGTVGLRTPISHEEESYLDKNCTLEDFHGFNNKMEEIRAKYTAIKIEGYHG